jgi:hypothetical protein
MDPRNEVHEFEPLGKGLTELKPILKQLSKITPIYWLIQPPGPLLVSKNASPLLIGKIHGCNQRIREILKSVAITSASKLLVIFENVMLFIILNQIIPIQG